MIRALLRKFSLGVSGSVFCCDLRNVVVIASVKWCWRKLFCSSVCAQSSVCLFYVTELEFDGCGIPSAFHKFKFDSKIHLYRIWMQHWVWSYSVISLQCESKKPPRFSGIFSQMVGNFSTKFYSPIMHSYLRQTANFCSISCNFDEVMPY